MMKCEKSDLRSMIPAQGIRMFILIPYASSVTSLRLFPLPYRAANNDLKVGSVLTIPLSVSFSSI